MSRGALRVARWRQPRLKHLWQNGGVGQTTRITRYGDLSVDTPNTGTHIILSGSSTLTTSTLLEHGLADEVLLLVYPVLLGTGKRFFAEGAPARSFELVSTQAMPSGIIFSTYKVVEPLKTGQVDDATASGNTRTP